MWPLKKTCNKTNNNDTIAKSRHRRIIKALVKMNLEDILHTDCLSLSATKSKVTDKCLFRADFRAVWYQHFADKITIYMYMHTFYISNAISIQNVYCMK